jgi:saccharopine dehydrogenase (NAD+, L-lysine-forming)
MSSKLKKILVLGGYGNAGYPLAKLLLQHTNSRAIIAGRNLARANNAVTQLNREFEGQRVSSLRLDASDSSTLREAFSGIDMVIAASSTTRHAKIVTTAALNAGIDYLDIQLSTEEKLETLKSLEKDIKKKNLCFITDGGFHPGLPGAMVRYAATELDALYKANIGSLLNINWGSLQFSEATIREFTEEITREIARPRPAIYRARRWRKAGMFKAGDYPKFDFGEPYGKRYCAPMFMEEMRLLPEMFPTLQETAFYVSGFNWFVDRFVLPLLMIGVKTHPKGNFSRLTSLMNWGLRTFSKPPYGIVLQLEVSGEKQGVPAMIQMKISHEDAYWLTAAPVAACLLQYLDGGARKPGLWLMAHIVEPRRLWKDMEMMGIKISFHLH